MLNDHSLIHAAKVCVLAAVLGRKMSLSENDILKLMTAAVFHDTGRVNNGNDASHGDKSFEKMLHSGYRCPEGVERIIRLHSRSDRNKGHSLLSHIFKDADALDRIRTGDLDETFLRFDAARELVDFAKELNECLSKAPE